MYEKCKSNNTFRFDNYKQNNGKSDACGDGWTGFVVIRVDCFFRWKKFICTVNWFLEPDHHACYHATYAYYNCYQYTVVINISYCL